MKAHSDSLPQRLMAADRQRARPRTGLELLQSAFDGQHDQLATDLVSIIVVNFNTREYALACLRSLAVHEPFAQIIVVDNASTDGSLEAIAEEFPEITLLQLSQNIGFGRACMVGMQAADHDVIVVLHSDAEFTDRSLNRCIRELRSRPELGAVTPKLRGPDGLEQSVRQNFPTLFRPPQQPFSVPSIPPNDDDAHWIPATCMVLKRKAIEDAGGLFHPLLFMSWEDTDLCARLIRAGYQVSVVNDAEILHHSAGQDFTGRPGHRAWHTFGRHLWFAAHRSKCEAAFLWLLDFVKAVRCTGRAIVRSSCRPQFRDALMQLTTLLRYVAGRAPVFAISDTCGRRDHELIVRRETLSNAVRSKDLQDVGAVVIGRNEGRRLRRCLISMAASDIPVVYVDSGSTDGSQDLARYLGVALVELDLTAPTTSARARNAGLRELLRLYPDLHYVQFVDGDCEISEDWLTTGRSLLTDDSRCVVVCGTLQQRHPEKSVYNRLYQLESRRPNGQLDASGGIFMCRVEAVQQVGGFNEALLDGEVADMCLRLHQNGWTICSRPDSMAHHDAAMTRFGQWWMQAVRAGHCCAEVFARHGNNPERLHQRHLRSTLFWGFLLPVAALLTAWPSQGASLPLLAIGYIQLYASIREGRRNSGERPEDARIYARFAVLGKFAQLQGIATYWLRRGCRRASRMFKAE